MIPKILHFIWIGDNKPNYVDFAINNFREVNPDFKINFVFEKDIENPTNDDVKQYLKKFKPDEKNSKSFIIQFVDLFRKFLLIKYGGIYLDCDTFPIRPFNDELLKLNKFNVTRSYGLNFIIYHEIFFMGRDLDTTKKYVNVLYPVDSFYDNKVYQKNKKDFKNCILKYGTHCNDPRRCYIDHYNDYLWKKDKNFVSLTKWDMDRK